MTSIESIINRQFLLWGQQKSRPYGEQTPVALPLKIVTVSRQTGSRGSYFASRRAQKLGYQRIHREIVDAICTSSGYRKRIIESLDERYRSNLDTLVNTLLTGEAIDHNDYYYHLYQVVLSMAELGGVEHGRSSGISQQQGGAAGQPSEGGGQADGVGNDDDVVDAEFTERS